MHRNLQYNHKLLVSLIIVFLSVFSSKAQEWTWAVNPSSYAADISTGIAVDSNGNSYTVGYSQSVYKNSFGVEYFPMIVGNDTLWMNTQSAIIAKYDKDGNAVWGRSANTDSGLSLFTCVSLSNDGSIYAAGNFRADNIIIGDITLQRKSSVDSYDVFIVKFDENGNVIDAQNFGGYDGANIHKIAVDKEGSVYIAGSLKGKEVRFGDILLSGPGSSIWYDIFVVKLDDKGKALWGKASKGGLSEYHKTEERDRVTSIAVDNKGGVYITGFFNSLALWFDTIQIPYSNPRPMTAFTAKLSAADGTVNWVKTGDPADNKSKASRGADIATDKDGNVYVMGYFNASSVSFEGHSLDNLNDPGFREPRGPSMFLVKYDENGDVMWLKRPMESMFYEEVNNNSFDEEDGRIAVDDTGNVFITASFKKEITIGDETYETDYNNKLSEGIVVKFNSELTPIWYNYVSDRFENRMRGIGVDSSDGVYLAITSKTNNNRVGDLVYFGNEIEMTNENSVATYDMFVAKIKDRGANTALNDNKIKKMIFL